MTRTSTGRATARSTPSRSNRRAMAPAPPCRSSAEILCASAFPSRRHFTSVTSASGPVRTRSTRRGRRLTGRRPVAQGHACHRRASEVRTIAPRLEAGPELPASGTTGPRAPQKPEDRRTVVASNRASPGLVGGVRLALQRPHAFAQHGRVWFRLRDRRGRVRWRCPEPGRGTWRHRHGWCGGRRRWHAGPRRDQWRRGDDWRRGHRRWRRDGWDRRLQRRRRDGAECGFGRRQRSRHRDLAARRSCDDVLLRHRSVRVTRAAHHHLDRRRRKNVPTIKPGCGVFCAANGTCDQQVCTPGGACAPNQRCCL